VKRKTEIKPSKLERARLRDTLSQMEWGLIFEELYRRDLVDLTDEYIQESAFFERAEELELIFTNQEESNLFCIHRLQEAALNLELELKRAYKVQAAKE
jgi:hypothetical protein